MSKKRRGRIPLLLALWEEKKEAGKNILERLHPRRGRKGHFQVKHPSEKKRRGGRRGPDSLCRPERRNESQTSCAEKVFPRLKGGEKDGAQVNLRKGEGLPLVGTRGKNTSMLWGERKSQSYSYIPQKRIQGVRGIKKKALPDDKGRKKRAVPGSPQKKR